MNTTNDFVELILKFVVKAVRAIPDIFLLATNRFFQLIIALFSSMFNNFVFSP